MAVRQIALLRGINVGRAKRVAMADLRAVVESLGYRDVGTLLNSGNVVLTGPEGGTARRIEEAVSTRLGVSARVSVLTARELAEIVAENPLLDVATDPSRLLVSVLADPADRKKLEPLLDQDWGEERLGLGARVAYLWCPAGVLGSRLEEAVGRLVKDGVTARNWSTVLKLRALAIPPG